MLEKKLKKSKLPKGIQVNIALDKKYTDQPVFKEKVDKANHILKTVGLPKF
jgi:hypothetical protein